MDRINKMYGGAQAGAASFFAPAKYYGGIGDYLISGLIARAERVPRETSGHLFVDTPLDSVLHQFTGASKR